MTNKIMLAIMFAALKKALTTNYQNVVGSRMLLIHTKDCTRINSPYFYHMVRTHTLDNSRAMGGYHVADVGVFSLN